MVLLAFSFSKDNLGDAADITRADYENMLNETQTLNEPYVTRCHKCSAPTVEPTKCDLCHARFCQMCIGTAQEPAVYEFMLRAYATACQKCTSRNQQQWKPKTNETSYMKLCEIASETLL